MVRAKSPSAHPNRIGYDSLNLRCRARINLNKLAKMASSHFQLYVWRQRSLLLSPAHASREHRHHAAQITLGIDGPVVFKSSKSGMHCADLLLIRPDVAHAHPAFGAAAMLFLEPEGIEWKRSFDTNRADIVSLPMHEAFRSFARSAAEGDTNAAVSLADTLIGETTRCSNDCDPLVKNVCDIIQQRLHESITLVGLSKHACLSPSRLAHRFRDSVGVPLRRYVLWSRLRVAMQSTMQGASLTSSAHAAGFADSAHLSRTFRSMYGMSPSFLFGRGRLDVTFVES